MRSRLKREIFLKSNFGKYRIRLEFDVIISDPNRVVYSGLMKRIKLDSLELNFDYISIIKLSSSVELVKELSVTNILSHLD